jgi:diguanylate cyclase (GGDEF)-like protein
MVAWILVGVFLLVAAVLAVLLAKKIGQLRELSTGKSVMEREFESARRELMLLQQDQSLQTKFIMEFLELSKRMDSLASSRTIPRTLLEMVVKTFEPEAAIVLTQKKTGPRMFTVVAMHPASASIQPGMSFPAHEGELGILLRTQRVMSKDDFMQATYQQSVVGKKQALPGFTMSLAAPMSFNQELFGVVAISRPRRKPAASREVLGLIAQLGALSYHNSVAYNQIKETSQVDELTQIANKASVRDALERELSRAKKRGHRSSAFLFDIDNFKNYNDVNGHLAGDDLLRELARLVSQNVRDYDFFGRFGGEEFLLILPETDSAGALAVAEKIRSAIASEPFTHREKQPMGCISVSGGVATFPENGRDAQTLLKLADEALYDAKEEGRNRIKLARTLAVQVPFQSQTLTAQ